jgi:hypothetical protein
VFGPCGPWEDGHEKGVSLTMNAGKKRQAGARGVLLVAMMLCIALVAMSPALYAAPAESGRKASVERTTTLTLDPFELKLVEVSVSRPQPVIRAESTISTASTASTQRPLIRIPPRLPLRSAFHPVL